MIMKTARILQDPFSLPFLHPNHMQPLRAILKMHLGKNPRGPILLEVRSLSASSQHYTGRCLTDHLCRIQKASCFNLSAPALLSARGNMVHDSDLGEPCLWVGNLVAALVQHHRTKASPPMEILWPLLQSAVDSRRLEITYIENSFLNTRPNYI